MTLALFISHGLQGFSSGQTLNEIDNEIKQLQKKSSDLRRELNSLELKMKSLSTLEKQNGGESSVQYQKIQEQYTSTTMKLESVERELQALNNRKNTIIRSSQRKT